MSYETDGKNKTMLQNIIQKIKKADRSAVFFCIIAFAGVVSLLAMYFSWYVEEGARYELPGLFASFAALLLFTAACIGLLSNFVWKCRDLRKKGDAEYLQEQYRQLRKKEHFETLVVIFLAFAAVNVTVILLCWGLRAEPKGENVFGEYIEFWKCLDSGHYLQIAEDWYLSEGEWDRLVQLVFFPLYPLTIRVFKWITGEYLYASLIASTLFFSLSGCVFYRLLRLDYSKRDSLRILKFLCILPGAFFFAAPMTESLFFLLTVSFFYAIRRDRWIVAGVFGALATFTRSLGIVLLVPAVIELIMYFKLHSKDGAKIKKTVKRALCILIIPIGLITYLYINYRVSGDPFKFLYYQKEHWGQETGYFFNTAAYQVKYAIRYAQDGNYSSFWGLWIANIVACLSSLIMLFRTSRKIRPSYGIYYAAYYFVAIGATWLLSGPRYLLATPFWPIALGVVTGAKEKSEYLPIVPKELIVGNDWKAHYDLERKPTVPKYSDKKKDLFATVICITLNLLYMYMFAMRWQVW